MIPICRVGPPQHSTSPAKPSVARQRDSTTPTRRRQQGWSGRRALYDCRGQHCPSLGSNRKARQSRHQRRYRPIDDASHQETVRRWRVPIDETKNRRGRTDYMNGDVDRIRADSDTERRDADLDDGDTDSKCDETNIMRDDLNRSHDASEFSSDDRGGSADECDHSRGPVEDSFGSAAVRPAAPTETATAPKVQPARRVGSTTTPPNGCNTSINPSLSSTDSRRTSMSHSNSRTSSSPAPLGFRNRR
jgi:hypothetical protein